MKVESAIVRDDGMKYLEMQVNGQQWLVPPELKGSVLADGAVPVLAPDGAIRPPSAPMAQLHVGEYTDDPVVLVLACRFWLASWGDELRVGPMEIPTREEAEIEAELLRERIRTELAALDSHAGADVD